METYEKFTDTADFLYFVLTHLTFKMDEDESECQILSSFTVALQIEEKNCLVISVLHSQTTLVQSCNNGRGSKSQSHLRLNLLPFKEFGYHSKHDKKGSERFKYSKLQMAETMMEAVRKTIANELHSETEIICQG